MESEQEDMPPTCIRTLIDNIIVFLTNKTSKNVSLISIKNDNLRMGGDLHMVTDFRAWHDLFEEEDKCTGMCTSIVQHYLHIRRNDVIKIKREDAEEEVIGKLIELSEKWPMKIRKYSSDFDKIALYLDRPIVMENTLRYVYETQQTYGRTALINKVFSLKVHEDKNSEITTVRLRLMKGVAERIVKLMGGRVSDDKPDHRLIFTTRSQGEVEENYIKCVCGVVKNAETQCKEMEVSWEQYINNKFRELMVLSQLKVSNAQGHCRAQNQPTEINHSKRNLAIATATFEMLCVKPSKPVLIRLNATPDTKTTHTKGVSFILYNAARIRALFDKYNEKKLTGEYPDFEKSEIDFTLLCDEDEWEIVYNCIIGYQTMIEECVKHDPVLEINPQLICAFLTSLCKTFSGYYYRTRILTSEYDHLCTTLVARMYMLNALRIVLENALALLDISPLPRM